MTQPNQSELEQLLDYLYEKGYDSGDGMSKYPKDVAILETQAKIERYITANYTPKDLTDDKKNLTPTYDDGAKLCNNQPKQDLAIRDEIEFRLRMADVPEKCVNIAANSMEQLITANFTPKLDPFDFVEPCEPDCTDVRHAYHEGQWDMAHRMVDRGLTKDKEEL